VDDEPAQAQDAAEGEAPAADTETPTAPFSALSEEAARARLEDERASGATPPEGTPLLGEVQEDGTRQLDADSAPALIPHRSAQGLAATAARDIGRVREVNQDSVFAMLTTLPREGGDVTVGLFIVADGMGGHQGGEVASRLAVRTVVHQVLSQLVLPALDDSMTEALQPLMTSAVQAANEAIWEAAQTLGTDMGTTCTAALLVGHSLYIAHVGDSRAYLFEPGGLRALTADHSTVGRLIQVGQLDPSEAREHPLRNQLYRTVGQQPQVQVDFVYQPVGQSSHLLLCSDGLWGLLEEPLMEQALRRSPWTQDACDELIALANLAGGDDNISAIVVSLPITER
jgi:serine/threonine protein phosphatase PrpC